MWVRLSESVELEFTLDNARLGYPTCTRRFRKGQVFRVIHWDEFLSWHFEGPTIEVKGIGVAQLPAGAWKFLYRKPNLVPSQN